MSSSANSLKPALSKKLTNILFESFGSLWTIIAGRSGLVLSLFLTPCLESGAEPKPAINFVLFPSMFAATS